MISKHLYSTIQRIRGRFSSKQIPEVMGALNGDPGAISLLRAKQLINLEEFNLLQMIDNYRHHIEPVDSNEGRPVFANIYDLLLIYDHRDQQEEWVFRGQANVSWGYSPSEARLSDYQEIECWKHFRALFLKAVSEQYPELYEDYWEMLALAQHYGFKTMLLDFSFSLQVAAFFASNVPTSDAKIGCIMCISRRDFESLHLGQIRIVESPKKNERLRRQEGCFVSRFNPKFLSERGLFEAPCFKHTPEQGIYKNDTKLTMSYLFPDEPDDPIRQLGEPFLRGAGRSCKSASN